MKPRYTDSARYPHGYKTAVDTDVRKTFERIRKEHEAQAKQKADNEREAVEKIVGAIKHKRSA